ncbi:uncharacterized protein [Elaeis guineensis]|uniref:Uncharacterized protein LOC105044763 n=1 Tax=Elaeis guineensis var. tenera TaxID=51953 RepID=A0A6I9RCE3_ELAGV|nr:uncharacterized protein LOC105044763 [Elaeis guineensis]
MPQCLLSHKKYSYSHHDQKGPSQAIDVHDIVIKKSKTRVIVSYVGILIYLATAFYSLLVKEELSTSSFWSILVGVLFDRCLQYKPVKKESVVIMPTFGVQLETHCWSGRVIHRFVPIGKILRPVLNECVTPVTCYWSLALMLHGKEKLVLVFQELQPPVKMLVPVWKALCAATNGKEISSS